MKVACDMIVAGMGDISLGCWRHISNSGSGRWSSRLWSREGGKDEGKGGTREGWGRGNEGKGEARVGGGIGGDCWSW